MANKHNQTEPAWLTQPTALGTGGFLVPDVQSSEARAVRKEYIKDITYQECVKRAELVLVFKWVPQSVASFSILSKTPCGQDCVDTCTEPGCDCWDGKCK